MNKEELEQLKLRVKKKLMEKLGYSEEEADKFIQAIMNLAEKFAKKTIKESDRSVV